MLNPSATPHTKLGSAMCWFFGKQISEGLSPTGDVPVGLIASDWGGTALIEWTPADAVADCAITANCTGKGWIGGDHYNAMVNPFTVGPMTLSGFAWYQGENGCGAPTGTDPAGPCITMPTDPKPIFNNNINLIIYDCLFPAMIKSWRRAFKAPNAYFGFIQLASWMAMGGGGHRDRYGNGDRNFALAQAGMRQAQMSGATLPNVGYATYADCGEGVLHPTNKWRPGARLGNSALSIQFGKRVPWISPTYESATVGTTGDAVALTVVTVTLGNATALETITPHLSGPCSRQMRCVSDQEPSPRGRAGILALSAKGGCCTHRCCMHAGPTPPPCCHSPATCKAQQNQTACLTAHCIWAKDQCVSPPPPPPPPPPPTRRCIPANISAGWAGYPENIGGDCGWAAIESADGGWTNATVFIKGSGNSTQLVLQAPAALVKGAVVATSYGWGVFAMISTYTVAQVNGTLAGSDTPVGGIPVLPWNHTL